MFKPIFSWRKNRNYLFREISKVRASKNLRAFASKNKTQTAVISMVNKKKLDVSYAEQHTFLKVTVSVFENCLYSLQ